ncbi:hypothetical protein ACFQZ4_01740 [Catellatospora coxensis]
MTDQPVVLGERYRLVERIGAGGMAVVARLRPGPAPYRRGQDAHRGWSRSRTTFACCEPRRSPSRA